MKTFDQLVGNSAEIHNVKEIETKKRKQEAA
jgi:hypothetical protein